MLKNALAALILMLIVLASSAVQAGMITYWAFDEGDGVIAADTSGNGMDATIDGAEWTTGIKGAALQFAGNDDKDIVTADAALGITTDTFTITAWVKRTGEQSDWAGIVYARALPSNVPSAGMNINTNGTLRYNWTEDKWPYNPVDATGDEGFILPDDQWAFVAMVVEPTQAQLYVIEPNGTVHVGTNELEHLPETFASPFVVGHDRLKSEGLDGRYFTGSIDEVMIFDEALDEAQLLEVAGIPEPMTLTLALLGLAPLAVMRRRR
jgi:hypothetical protein